MVVNSIHISGTRNKKYHHRGKDYKARGTIIDRVMIDKRPKIVEKKSCIGDLVR